MAIFARKTVSMLFVDVLIQIVDYIVKALTRYRLTEEGAKEWNDIYSAWEKAEEAAMNPDTIVKEAGEPAPTPEDIADSGRRIVRQERVVK